MTVLFDGGTGRLRLSPDSWQALRDWGEGRSRHDARTAALHEAGVIDRGRPHPSVQPALEAALEPLVRLTVEQQNHEGRRIDGVGWVSRGAAALLLDAPDDLCELVTVHPAMLAAALARVVALGPRLRGAPGPLRVPDDAVPRLLGTDMEQRRRAVHAIGDDRAAPWIDGPWSWWSLSAQWDSGPWDGGAQRGLTVLDSRPQLWRLERSPGVHVLWPTDPTAVWRLLTLLLPSDEELSLHR